MIINQANLQGLYTSFKVLFNNAFADAATYHGDVAMTVSAGGKEVSYPWLGNFPGMKEWVGERQIESLVAHEYTIKNKKFESTVEVDRDDIEDDSYGVYTPIIQEMGRSAKAHPDELVFNNLLINGWDVACYDKKPFFSEEHPVGDKNFSNSGGGNETAWFLMDLSRAIKPIILQIRKKPQFVARTRVNDDNVFYQNKYIYGVDDRKNVGFGLWQLAYGSKQAFSDVSYAAARAAMQGYTNEAGKPLGIRPTHLVHGPSLEGDVRKILKAELIGSTSNIWKDTAIPLMVPWLP